MRKFAEGPLTHSMAHHLLAVDELIRRQGYARVTDIARQLEITRGSVSVAMHSLESAGLVAQDENRFYRLDEAGQRLVDEVRTKHQVMECVLQEVLGLTSDQAHEESCRFEHLLDNETARRLVGLLRFWRKRRLGRALQEELLTRCPQNLPEARCPCPPVECLCDTKTPRRSG